MAQPNSVTLVRRVEFSFNNFNWELFAEGYENEIEVFHAVERCRKRYPTAQVRATVTETSNYAPAK